MILFSLGRPKLLVKGDPEFFFAFSPHFIRNANLLSAVTVCVEVPKRLLRFR
jgi:hypothetical protein